MKKTIEFFIFMVLSFSDLSVLAQSRVIIPPSKEKAKSDESVSYTYDSLTNLLPVSLIHAYKGQKLIIMPRQDKIIGYSGVYRKLKPKVRYAPGRPDLYTICDSLALREFMIDSTIFNQYSRKGYLVLCDQRDTLYLEYPTCEDFVIEGYIEKMERPFENEKFIFRDTELETLDPFTNEPVRFEEGKAYTYKQIFIYNDPDLRILFQSPDGKNLMCNMLDFSDRTFINKKDHDKLIRKRATDGGTQSVKKRSFAGNYRYTGKQFEQIEYYKNPAKWRIFVYIAPDATIDQMKAHARSQMYTQGRTTDVLYYRSYPSTMRQYSVTLAGNVFDALKLATHPGCVLRYQRGPDGDEYFSETPYEDRQKAMRQ